MGKWEEDMTNAIFLPPCLRCRETDRMSLLGKMYTDFGGSVTVWVCRRCGVAAVLAEGSRPND